MAIYEKSGVLNYLDADGNKNILYPVTKTDDVDGLDEELAKKVNVADVVNNLTSTDTSKPLSAKQGKTLQDTKQEKLVSGTNIKTINGTSILGSGDMETPLPIANASTLGGVKIGSGINVTSEGVISAQSYSLPTASASVKGGIKIGSGLSISNEVASINLTTIANAFFPVGSCYVTSTNTNPNTILGIGTWQLMSNVALASESVFGNGLGMALSNNLTTGAITLTDSAHADTRYLYQEANLGSAIGTSSNDKTTIANKYVVGSPTKALLGSTPSNSGLIVDTITIYMWKRTA